MNDQYDDKPWRPADNPSPQPFKHTSEERKHASDVSTDIRRLAGETA